MGSKSRETLYGSSVRAAADKLYDELRAKKAIVLMPPKNMPWKLREMQVGDPDGNVIRFASATRH